MAQGYIRDGLVAMNAIAFNEFHDFPAPPVRQVNQPGRQETTIGAYGTCVMVLDALLEPGHNLLVRLGRLGIAWECFDLSCASSVNIRA